MTSGRELGGRYRDDPVGSESRGKNRERRKHKLDGPTLTPTEQHLKDSCMKQFCHLEGGTNSEAYKSASCWCVACDGRRLAVEDGYCGSCLARSNEQIATACGRLLGPDAQTPHPDHGNP